MSLIMPFFRVYPSSLCAVYIHICIYQERMAQYKENPNGRFDLETLLITGFARILDVNILYIYTIRLMMPVESRRASVFNRCV